MKKYALTLWLFLLAASLFPCAATATNAEPDFYALLYADKTLVFQRGDAPETGRQFRNAYPVSLDGYGRTEDVPWRDVNAYVTRVTFADALSPASCAFWFDGFSYLQTIDGLDKLDASRAASTVAMFRGCSRLTELDMSKFDTSAVTDMSSMFENCSDLQTLNVSGFKTSNVRNMGSMFNGCVALKTLDVSGFDTSNVTEMLWMFRDCKSLESLDVSGFNTSNVTRTHGMFYVASSLKSLDVSHFDTSKVTDMSWMFSGCAALESLDVSGFNTSNATTMGAMFYGASSLKLLDVHNFDTSKVTGMGWMFAACPALESLDLSGFHTPELTDISFMFYGSSGLKSLDMRNFDTSKATDMTNLFAGCSSLTALDVSGFDMSSATTMQYMFAGCSSLTTLDVRIFNTSKVTNMLGTFGDCSSLTALDVSGFDTFNVTTMEHMFRNCRALTALKMDSSKFSTAKVTHMSGMFSGCSSLKSLDLDEFQTTNTINMREMFNQCAALTKLDLSVFDTAKVADMSSMFAGCSALETIYASGHFKLAQGLVSDNMFAGCASLSGGNGTAFDGKHLNAEYARLDKTSQAGYFTEKPAVRTFDVSRDAFRFGNTLQDFGYASRGGSDGGKYPIDPASFFVMYGETVRAKTLYKQAASAPWSGNCAGMSASAALLFAYGKLNASDFGAENVGQLSIGDKNATVTLQTLIEAMQVSQYTDAFGRARQANQLRDGQSLDALFAAVKSDAEKGRPTLIAIVKNGVGGHALLAVGADDAQNRLLVYDCNYPGQTRYLTLSDNRTAWSYDMGGSYGAWGSGDGACSISYVPYGVLEDIWTRRGNLRQDTQILTVNAENLSITNFKKETVATLENGRLVQYAEGVYEMPELSMYWSGERRICLPRNDVYSLSTSDDITLNATMTDRSMSAAISTTANSVTFSVNEEENINSVTVGNASASDTYSISLESDFKDNLYNVATFEGSGQEQDASVTMKQDGLTFVNCNVVSVITAAAPENGQLTITFLNSKAVHLAVSYFDADGKFVSAHLQGVRGDAQSESEAVIPIPADAVKARAVLLGDDYRPLCDGFEVPIADKP